MGLCNDKATSYLRQLGYNVVRHPQEGIQPLQLIGRQNNAVTQLGDLHLLITNAPSALPAVQKDQVATDVQGQTTSKLSVGIGLNLLGSFIGALGGNVGITTSYNQAQSVQFVFNDVVTDSVMPLEVGNYLRNGTVDADNLVLKQYVLGKGHLFLITKTVKARRFSVRAERKGGQEIKLQIPEIQGVVGGDVKVSGESESASVVTYEGSRYLTFGFQAYLVGVHNGELRMMVSKPGGIALAVGAGGDADEGGPVVLAENGLFEFD